MTQQDEENKIQITHKVNEKYLKARDPKDNYLLKDFYTYPLKDEVFIKYLSDLNHPYLLKINLCKSREQLIVVEEPSTSNDLIPRCANLVQSESLERQILLWLYQILSAVDYLHMNGVLHKRISKGWIAFVGDDLKLIINKQYSFYRGQLEPNSRVSRDECNFNAPEFTNLSSVISHKYDIWCVGWLLFNMCTLENPFDRLEDVEDFRKWSKPHLPQEFSAELNEIFLKLTEISPRTRPDAKEILDADIFFQFKFHIEKSSYDQRYVRLNSNDNLGRLSFLVVDERSHQDDLKLMKRYLKPNKNVEKIFVKKDNLKSLRSLNWLENCFEDELFIYTIEPVFQKSLINVLEPMRSNLDIQKVLKWFMEILEAVDVLHQNNIIHKYICPSFIGFDKNEQIKLGVYEKSELVGKSDELVEVKSSECAYNSPELLLMNKIDIKYDIWCLGWTLYKMLTLEEPYFELKAVKNVENFSSQKSISNFPEVNIIFKSLVQTKPSSRPNVQKVIEYFKENMDKIFGSAQIEKEDNIDAAKINFIQSENLIANRYKKMTVLSDDNFRITYLVEDLKRKCEKRELKMYKLNNIGNNQLMEIENLIRISNFPIWPSTILKYWSFSFDNQQLFTVSEYAAQTQTLDKRLAIEGTFINMSMKILWLEQLIHALSFLHKYNIIHRDIRPENIQIYSNDSIKLNNFAFKYFFTADNMKSFNVHTILYMSPELITLAPRHDNKTDIWSYGCVMYEMLTGERVFECALDDFSTKTIVQKIKSASVPSLTTPIKSLNSLFKKTLSKSSTDRPSADKIIEVFKDLRQ